MESTIVRRSWVAAGLLLTAVVARADQGPLLPLSSKPAAEPIVCDENQDILIANRSISTPGDGVVVSGNCDLRIVDSHIDAGAVAVRVDGNGSVSVQGSFVQGRRAAVYADGNATAEVRGSTFRGGLRAAGNAELIDAGGNRREQIPGAADPELTAGEAFSCGDNDRLTVVHRYVRSEADGITLLGDCELLLSDSHVVAAGAALRIVGSGTVRLRNSTIDGGVYGVLIEADGVVSAAGSNLVGDLETGAGRFIDGGGNSDSPYSRSADHGTPAGAGSGAGSRSSAAAGTHVRIGPGGVEVSGRDGGSGGRVKVGPGGVEVSGREGATGSSNRVRVGAGGVEIRGDGRVRQPPETCEQLCEIWPAVVSSKQSCVSTVFSLLDYPVLDIVDCIEVETEGQCRVCAEKIDARDHDCRTAYDRCIAR